MTKSEFNLIRDSELKYDIDACFLVGTRCGIDDAILKYTAHCTNEQCSKQKENVRACVCVCVNDSLQRTHARNIRSRSIEKCHFRYEILDEGIFFSGQLYFFVEIAPIRFDLMSITQQIFHAPTTLRERSSTWPDDWCEKSMKSIKLPHSIKCAQMTPKQLISAMNNDAIVQ